MAKQKILIVDDSKVKREHLIEKLGDKYEICEEENAEQAIARLDFRKARPFALVFFDLEQKEVLYYIKKQGWLETLPVIATSESTDEFAVRQMRSLGACDCFLGDMESDVVQKRVSEIIALYSDSVRDLKDAIGMLADTFYCILKINLETDTYRVLKDITFYDQKPLKGITGISEAICQAAKSGYVYKEDQADFLSFCDFKNIRQKFLDGATRITFNYRSRVESEYRWVSMEIIKGADYREDYPVIMVYIQDINDDYMKQLEMVMGRKIDAVGVVSLRVSDDVCTLANTLLDKLKLEAETEKIESYIKRISAYIPQEEKAKDFVERFSKKNILESFANGEISISGEYFAFFEVDMRVQVYRVVAEMIRNSYSDKVEAVLYFVDITNEYMNRRLPEMLYQKNFDEIAIVDLRRKTIAVDSTENVRSVDYLKEEKQYSDYIEDLIKRAIPEEERDLFRKSTEIELMKRELERMGSYSFTIHQLDKSGKKRVKNYSYLYLERHFESVLVAVEDVTDVSGQDPLTGGYNRQGFIEHTEEILEKSQDKTKYAILFFNLKNFKAVNELIGVDNADSILRYVYEEIKDSTLEPLIIARSEADHFICLVKKESLDFDELTRCCTKVYAKNGKKIHLFCRCGVFYVEEKPMHVSGMIDRARLAKQYITDEYVQPYKVYDKWMKIAYIDKAEIAGALDEGIENNQFEVYYQPVVDVNTNKIVSAEALIRWKHPERGMVSPALFIPALEESGRISGLDFYVIKQVHSMLKRRHERGETVVPVSVNLSWMDFYDEEIMNWILNKPENDFVSNQLMRFEITETSYAALGENRDSVLASMRQKGLKILLDDFGSGYSSFGMLQTYSFDILKIDRSFVSKIQTNPKTKSVIHCIIEMAHEMGMHVVAEGAEEKAEVDFLGENGCDYIQGYYYYKPMNQQEFERVLKGD